MLAGGATIWRAVQAFAHQHLHDLNTGIAPTAGAGALNLAMGLILRDRGKRAHSIAMEASGTHLLSDAWSTVAMVCGLVLIHFTGLLWLDQLFAILRPLHHRGRTSRVPAFGGGHHGRSRYRTGCPVDRHIARTPPAAVGGCPQLP